ncbi:MAG: ABC transporter permease [Phycisphaerales bacterium]|nr:ABC transporter permease [Phycisphaerales bacterium]
MVFIVIGAGTFGPLWKSSFQYSNLCRRIATVLTEANIAERNPIALQLIERGTVTIDGAEIGSLRVQSVAPQFFDRGGRIPEATNVASFIGSTVAPGWAPVNIIERPATVAAIGLTVVALAVVAVWVGMAWSLVLVVLGTTALIAPFWMANQLDWVTAIAGFGLLIFAFMLLTRIALVLLTPAYHVFGIAHTLLLEALRQRISLGFIGILLFVLPMLPIGIDRHEPLRYQIQTFISRGSSLVFVVAACLTLFLSCATVAFEIRDRQVWNVLTKPVSRFHYLAGKLLGLSILNGIVLLIGGFAVYASVELMSTRPAADLKDAAAVQEQVLVARAAARPAYESLDPARLQEIVTQTLDRDSILRGEIADGRRSAGEVAREIRRNKLTEFMAAQRAIKAGAERTFVFSGLLEARRAAAQPVLRYTFHNGIDSSHAMYPAVFLFGEAKPIFVNYVPILTNVVSIPLEAITPEGTLTLRIFNGGVTNAGEFYPAPNPMNFDDNGLEVLHRVGGFEGNFFRAMLIDWVKLIFIAALGVASASVLSFPVAVMLSFTVFMVGSMSPFLAVALENYSVTYEAPFVIQAFQYGVRSLVGFVQWGLAPFAQSGSATDLVDGKAITWWSVCVVVGQVGIAWTLFVFTLGVFAFNRKEIAIYSGGDG